MSDEAPAVQPAPPVPSTSAISLGMACSVMSVPVLLYTAHDIFFCLPKFMDVFKSIKVHVHMSTDLLSRYGGVLWVMVAIAIALSFAEAARRPSRRRTVAIQVAVFLVTLIFAYLVRHVMWYPWISLFQGIGTEK